MNCSRRFAHCWRFPFRSRPENGGVTISLEDNTYLPASSNVAVMGLGSDATPKFGMKGIKVSSLTHSRATPGLMRRKSMRL